MAGEHDRRQDSDSPNWGQLDPSARVIWALEKLGWAYDVRWPDEERLSAKRPATATRKLGSMTRRADRVRGAVYAESR